MLRWVSSFAFFCIAMTTANAASVSVSKSKQSFRSPEEILGALKDHENSCEAGCTYYVKGLKQSKIVRSDNEGQIVWQELKTLITVRQFVAYSESQKKDGTLLLKSEYPEQSILEELSASTGLQHQSSFRNFRVSWELSPVAGGTFVNARMEVDHSFPEALNKIIEQELKASIDSALQSM